jgi:flagellar protein FliO/FliZ
MPIDPKRRLVLLRRDNVEHLVILGATGETIVETNITPPPPKHTHITNAQEPASALSRDNGDTLQEDQLP